MRLPGGRAHLALMQRGDGRLEKERKGHGTIEKGKGSGEGNCDYRCQFQTRKGRTITERERLKE